VVREESERFAWYFPTVDGRELQYVVKMVSGGKVEVVLEREMCRQQKVDVG
jgi:hypothetical protein